MKGRVKFTSNDIWSGDASINITNIQLSDAGTYQCQVFHGAGAAKRVIQLAVVGKLLSSVERWLTNRVKGHGTKIKHSCKTNLSFPIILFIHF